MVTVYDIPNIEHCDVIPVGTIGHRVIAHEGWYIHYNNDVEDTQNVYRTYVILRTDQDLSYVEIVAESDLPEGAEICGGTTEPKPEVM